MKFKKPSAQALTKFSFTSSTVVGKLVGQKGSRYYETCCLELGGKSPLTILEDANLQKAVDIALYFGLQNIGQACVAGARILPPESRNIEIE